MNCLQFFIYNVETNVESLIYNILAYTQHSSCCCCPSSLRQITVVEFGCTWRNPL